MNNGTNIIWYKQGARSWNEALPLGNGRLGAMVYGGALHEKLSLNEDTLWSGYPAYYRQPEAVEAYHTAQALVREGQFKEAEALLQEKFTNYWSQMYLALGDLNVNFLHGDTVTGYSRQLDLSTGMHRVEYEADGVQYVRETWISEPDQVLVMHIQADKTGAVSFDVTLDAALKAETEIGADRISFRGHAPRYAWVWGEGQDPEGKMVYGETEETKGMGFFAQVRVRTDGKIHQASGALQVQKAAEATLYFDARTSFNGWNRHPVTEDERIKVENIRGRLIFIGAEDDVLWDTAKYIRRMEERLSNTQHESQVESWIYEHGTHFAFPESMIKMVLPVGFSLIVSMMFKAGKQYPKECRETRIDIDRRLRKALAEW